MRVEKFKPFSKVLMQWIKFKGLWSRILNSYISRLNCLSISCFVPQVDNKFTVGSNLQATNFLFKMTCTEVKTSTASHFGGTFWDTFMILIFKLQSYSKCSKGKFLTTILVMAMAIMPLGPKT